MGKRKPLSDAELATSSVPEIPKVRKPRTTTAAKNVAAEIPKTQKSESGAAAPGELARVGKDEMNLVEYPFAMLHNDSKRGNIIERHWEAEHPVTRKSLKASWRVTGDPDIGLPTACDERVFLVLMELTRESGFAQQIYFTRYDLLQRLNWAHNAQSYARLTDSFRRLTAVTITSENAFWNPTARVFHNRGFHILEAYDIVAERAGRKKAGADLPLSHFRWSRELADSFAAGYIRSIDLGIALTLDLPLSVRLFRYLDKKKHDGKPFFEIELRRLCEIHLGMTISRHASTMKVRLLPAHEELVRREIVQGVEFMPMKTKSSEKVRYLFLPPPSAEADSEAHDNGGTASVDASSAKSGGESDASVSNADGGTRKANLELPFGDLMPEEAAPMDEKLVADRLVQRMTRLGVASLTARQLVQETPFQTLAEQLDCLSDRKPKNPAATFVAAVRGGWSFPPAFAARLEMDEQRQNERSAARRGAVHKRELARLQSEREAREREEIAALDARFGQLSPGLQNGVEAQVGERMKFVVQHLGQEAAQAGWAATRRQILREQPQLEQQREETASGSLSGHSALLSSDAEIDGLWTQLNSGQQTQIEQEVAQRLTQTGFTRLSPQHSAWVSVRRNRLREKLKSGELSAA